MLGDACPRVLFLGHVPMCERPMMSTSSQTGSPTTAAGTPKLVKTLGLTGAVGFGLAYMMPMASFTTYGVVNTMTEGAIVTSYVVTLIAMLFTASSYASMAGAFPTTGAAYTYTRRSLGGHIGFLGGWTILLDYVLLPMMAYLVIGIYMAAAVPAVPQQAWIVLAIVAVTVLNSLGVKLLSGVSNAIVAAQVVFVAMFLVLASTAAAGNDIPSVFDVVFGGSTDTALILAGSAVLCYSFLGFDAVSSLAEETKSATRNIPRAIMLVTLIGGVLFIVVSALSNLAVPDWTSYQSPDAAANDVTFAVGGAWFEVFFTAAFVAGCFGAVMAQQATASRLLFSMGRDGVLPRAIFGTLHPKFKTPVRATVFISLIGLVSLFIDMNAAASLINFGALTAFSLVNLSVIKHFFIDKKRRAGFDLVRFLVLPLIGFALSVWLWTSLDANAMTVGLIWLGLGALYLVWLTRGFRQAPPELELNNAAE